MLGDGRPWIGQAGGPSDAQSLQGYSSSAASMSREQLFRCPDAKPVLHLPPAEKLSRTEEIQNVVSINKED